ncbi:DUF6090 family protein [uncultured Croceitalea sp.]|uniref:DUF6090 family protein n=1 Tax=uncultured Croceitalea sp. TaxID=1798908 RepID=UPI0033062432
MLNFFKRKRREIVSSNSFWKYFKYALGEIVLIVIGVLVAVSIDNWNTSGIKEKQLNEIILKMKSDFQEDEKSLQFIREHYMTRKPLFDSIIDSRYSVNAIAKCKECHFLISGHLLFRPNVEGFSSVKRYVQGEDIENQKLLSFIQSYTILLDELQLMKSNIINDVNGNLIQWRDSYDWFTPFFQGKDNDDYYNYQTNTYEYRNKVAYHYALVYENYLPALQRIRDLQNQFLNP